MIADNNVWTAVQREIAARITSHQYETWFGNVRFRFAGADCITIRTPNKFHQTYIQHRFLPVIMESIETVTHMQQPRLEFLVAGEEEPVEREEASEETPARPARIEAPFDPSLVTPTPYPRDLPENLALNRNYTFEHFVTGDSNQLAHAAAQAIAEKPGSSYNPVFIYGQVGLGKTHLMQAVAHTYLARGMRRLVYLSCSSFTDDFIAAVSKGELEGFREKYRKADALLIDDIQFLANKEKTQEEFFHTFNAVYNEQKQIFLSSDCLPDAITGLNDRLISRFRLGLVAELSAPSFETRVAIIQRKAQNLSVQVPTDVAQFVAERVRDNIRELEGAVLRLRTLVNFENKALTVDEVRRSLVDLLGGEQQRIDLLKIQQAVLEEFDVLPSQLHSAKRTRSVVIPRQLCMYLAREHTDLSLTEIGNFFGGRDHSTVLYGIERVKELMDRDPRIRRSVETIERRLGC